MDVLTNRRAKTPLEGKILSSRVYPEFFSLRGHERVLNVGFGEGPQALVYAGRFASMTGVDVQADRLERARRTLETWSVKQVELIAANVEAIPRSDGSFDAALAVDIIEHVEHPDRFTAELFRLLAPGGRLLVTFPAMHDRFMDAMSVVGRVVKPWKKRADHPAHWHPDHHQRELPVAEWHAIVERAGFRFVRSRATTLFPPLHLYGFPRFWFSWEWLHAIDRALCRTPLQRFGQTVMAEFVKPDPQRMLYITNMRFPTEKAHGLQIAKMCEAFTMLGRRVTLVVPDRQTPIAETPERYYGVKQTYPIVRLPIFDAFAVSWMPRLLAFALVEWGFLRAVQRWADLAEWRASAVFTRDQFLVKRLFGKVGTLLFEAHDVSPAFFRLHKRMARAADVIVTTNAWKAEEMKRQWGMRLRGRMVIAPNGIDLAPYERQPSKEEARRGLGWDVQTRYIVYAGGFYAWKGVYTLADASFFLPPNIRVAMIGGTKEDFTAMQDYVRDRHLDRVDLYPHASRSEVLVYASAADALVIPNSGKSWNSRYTTSPIKLWEYLAAQRPVVVSDLPSMRELVTDHEVRFVAPDDPRALADALAVASQGDDARVAAGWERVQRQTWLARAERILENVSFV